MEATENTGNTVIYDHDLGDLNSLSTEQFYSRGTSDVVITVELERDPT